MRFALAFVLVVAPSAFALFAATNNDCQNLAGAIDVCAVLADAAKYDGKEITVKAIDRAVIHGSIIYGAGCSADSINLRRAPNWRGDKAALKTMRSLAKKNQFQEFDVVSRGVFRVARQGQCFGQDCWRYDFEEADLMCAAAAKK